MTRKPPSPLGAKLLELALAGGILLLWMVMDWPCLFRHFTGLPCMGCGMTRAWLAAFRLDFPLAFYYHPMFWCIPVLAVFFLFDGKLFRNQKVNNGILILILVGVLLTYPVRLIAYLKGFYLF